MSGSDNGENNEEKSDNGVSKYYEKKYVPGRGFKSYSHTLQTFIPIRRDAGHRGAMPSDSAGLFSFITMSWLSKYMHKAQKDGLKIDDLPKASIYDSCYYNVDRLEILWNEELAKKGPEKASFCLAAWRFCRTRIFLGVFIMILSFTSTAISYTLCLRELLLFVQSGDNASYSEGIKWAFLLTTFTLIRTLCVAWAWTINNITGTRLKSACFTLVYKKIIRLNNLGNQNIGEVINLLSNDSQRIFEVCIYSPLIVEAPIVTIYLVTYILRLFQPMALLGILVFFMFYPIQYGITRLVGYLQSKSIKVSDIRVRLMNEILDSIKLIKMYAWEKRFGKDIQAIRKKERKILMSTSYCQSLNISMAITVPIISASVTFIGQVMTGHNLTAAQAFPYMTYLETRFRVALSFFQQALESIVLARVSLNRVKKFLLLEETQCEILKPILKSQAVVITNGKFSYNNSGDHKEASSRIQEKIRNDTSQESGEKSEKEELNKPTDNAEYVDALFDISFEVEKGKLVGICGSVGSGKSSLLLAALGQLRVSEGQVMRDGSCAYVSQQAWITNATLRENILFGAEFDHSRYHKAIYACNLSQDIDMMPGGDRTEIGEKGVNLSGGQKQRVALARALYADRDIYLLDDPLSAVDSRVGAHIFENLILGALRGKTVLFVTHQIQYLNRCDDIYMMRDGKIVEHGIHDELMKLGNEYAAMVGVISAKTDPEDEKAENQNTEASSELHNTIPRDEDSQNRAADIAKDKNVEKSETQDAKLTVQENIQQGSVKAHTYHSYIVAAGGYFFSFIVLVMLFLSIGSTAFNSWWLASWIKAGGGNATIVRNNETIPSDNIIDNPDFTYYRNIYAGTSGFIIVITVLRTLIFTQATIGASTRMHKNLFQKIISSPMRFFDTTPIGRIQHLFSRDMDEVDKKLPPTLDNCVQSFLGLILCIATICIVLPWFIIPFTMLIIAYHFISKRYRVGIRDLKRLENMSRTPLISFLTASVQGLSTIRAFGKEDDFTRRFESLFDENCKFVFLFTASVRWLVLRVEVLSVSLIGITAILVIIFQVPPALGGLALSYTAKIATILSFVIRLLSETEVRFTSVERIYHYIGLLKGESKAEQVSLEPPPTWPEKAVIKFRNVNLTYAEGGLPILKDVSFTVYRKEKIGIVGRTGAGKSSLTVALFRLVELSGGKIEIDDVDISKISLEQLRNKLSIIPQDPVLFSGTIRSNLDPFKLYTDAEIWKALEKTELKGRVQSINGQLDASVGFGGDNLSVGERQLLCLARALLRNSKILVLDEATAAVDPETEIVVQETVNREFSECTILTIAHRLRTVLPLSRVLVMEDGRVLEFDTPSNLLGDQGSEFSKMLAAAKQSESE